MNLKNTKNIYMIGIKGVGMTMLAQYLAQKGHAVSGSDLPEVYMTDQVLCAAGIKVLPGFSPHNLPAEADLIIYSTAYNAGTNAELAAALQGRTKIITFAEGVASVFNEQFGIAVIGTHGKTTTSAWLAYVLHAAGLNPSAMIGANVPQFKGAALVGASDYLVAEVDEYQNKLQYFNPKAVLLNNIEYDHPDFFPSPEAYRSVFIEFIKKLPGKGFLVVNHDDKQVRSISSVNSRAKVISYAITESADYVAYDIKEANGKQYFKVKLGVTEIDEDDEDLAPTPDLLGDFCIQLAGRHNVYNALAVIACSIELGIDLSAIRSHLEDFSGTSRRMETMGRFRGTEIIDDYAHHPTEISTTLQGIRARYPDKHIRVVFHPHTYSRTKTLLEDFSRAFAGVDQLIVLDIYGSAREQQGGVHSLDLLAAIKKHQPELNARHIATLAECEQYLRAELGGDEILVLMGAGDVFRIGEKLLA